MKFSKAICLTCLTLSCLFSCSPEMHRRESTHTLFSEAKKHQERAAQAEEREEQMQEILSALQLNLELEKTLRAEGSSPSPNLYQTIGNAYALLQQPGWALFYYHQALSESPRDAQIQQHITELQKELSIPPSSFSSSYFGYQELLRATALFFTVAFVFGSYAIWLQSTRLKHLAIVCACTGLLPLLGAFYVMQGTVLYGIVIESSPVYPLPATHSSMQQPQPTRIILEGTQVEVLKGSPDPAWLKIRLNNASREKENDSLYIPSQSVRLIERKL